MKEGEGKRNKQVGKKTTIYGDIKIGRLRKNWERERERKTKRWKEIKKKERDKNVFPLF